MARTIEEIQDALDAIMGGVEDTADAVDFTDDELTQIAALEAEMTSAQERRAKSEAIRNRAKDGKAKGTPALIRKAGDDPDPQVEAFLNYLRTGKENLELVRAAQSEGTASEGGFTVPESFRQKLVDRMKMFGGLANVVEEVTTSDGRNLPWPTLDDTGNQGEIVDEGGTFSLQADLVFGEASLGAFSYMAGGASGQPLKLSKELVQDTAFDVEKIVTDKLGMRLARVQALHIVSGTGVKQPLGIVTGRTPVATVGNAITYTDLLAMVHSVDPAYRDVDPAQRDGGVRWVFNDTTLQRIRGILDTTGRPLVKGYGDAISTDPAGLSLLGYPVTIDQGFSNFTNNSTQIWGAFGDLTEGYVIRRVRDVEMLVNPWGSINKRQIEYSAWARMDATQQNTAAYSALTGHS